MIYLYVVLGLVAAYLICRYVPGFKCVTYCRLKTYKYEKATKKIEKMSSYDFSASSKKKLIKLYLDSTPFGCKSLFTGSDVAKQRELLKNAIAEKELLED
jgi:hypothetical protein